MTISVNFPGANQTEVSFGPASDLELYFSYTTCVGFYTPQTGRVVSENVWSVTTAKHLNTWQPDKKKRIPHDDFERKLELVQELVSV